MQPSTYVPSFYFYKLAQAISAPYTDLIAFKSGNIDTQGNIIKSVSSIDAFEFLVIKLKKIFEQLPYGITKASLSNYLATLQMFSEEVEKYDITQEQFHCLVEGIISQNTNNEVSYLELLEDMGTGGGAGAIGVPAQGGNINQGGVSGRDIRMGLPIMKRKKGDFFDNCEVFDVCPAEFVSFKNAKNWTDIPESETKRYLQRFQRRNKNGKMGISGINPVSGEKDLFWITYPSHNFMESKDLSTLNFLFEETQELNPDIFDSPDPGTKADSQEVAAAAAKRSRRGYTPPRIFPEDAHKEFHDHVKKLVERHKNAKTEAEKSEIEARIILHGTSYANVKDNADELKKYIEKAHKTIHSSVSATDRSSKASDAILVTKGEKGFEYNAVEVKSKKGTFRQHITNKLLRHLIDIGGQAMSAWSQPSKHPTQSFVFDLPETSEEAKKQSEERMSQLQKVLELPAVKSIRDTLIEKLQTKVQQSTVLKKKDGKFYLFKPQSSKPSLRSSWAKTFSGQPQTETARRHIRTFEQSVEIPKNTEQFKISSDANSAIMSAFSDSENQKYLSELLKNHQS